MLNDLKSFRKDWRRWSATEKATVVVFLLVASVGLVGQMAGNVL